MPEYDPYDLDIKLKDKLQFYPEAGPGFNKERSC